MNIMPVPVSLQIPDTNTKPKDTGASGFADMLNSAINKLNESQVKADDTMQSFLVGDIQDIHQVTIAMQEAKLTMQLAVEVRNKVMDAYQEISRMQL